MTRSLEPALERAVVVGVAAYMAARRRYALTAGWLAAHTPRRNPR